MPLLQEAQPKRDVLSSTHDSIKPSDDGINNTLNQLAFPTLPNTGMFTPSQLLVASQTAALMAASGLGLQNPAFFHPGLFSAWTSSHATNSPASPTTEKLSPSLEQLSPALKLRRNNNLSHHNNNNVVSSSSMEDIKVKVPRRKVARKTGNEEDLPISPPTSATSGSSPPSSSDITTVSNPNRDLSRDKQFTCGVCNRSFGYKHVLQNHERTHTGEKPFECPECHKRFTRDHHLKTHLRLHTGERPYHCEFCDRQFVQVANLRRHLRVHTGERPYACQYCPARFSDSNQLKAHVLIHKGEKPFECEQCNGKFRRRHHLLNHKCGNKEPDRPINSPAGSDVSDDAYHDEERKSACGLETTETRKTVPTIYLDELEKRKVKVERKTAFNLNETDRQSTYLDDLQKRKFDIRTERKTPYQLDEIEVKKQPAASYLEELDKRKSNREIRRVIRTSEPLISLPLRVALPEQTEPEDLSMSTGLHSHSSGDSPLSRSPCSPEREEDDYELDEAATLFLQRTKMTS